MTEHAVMIVGGGPTGLMLAAELKLAGVDALVLERRPSQELAGSRAGGLHSRTLEILDQRGIVDRFVSKGQVTHQAGFALIPLDIRDFPTRYNYVLGLWQNHIEQILAEWARELGVVVRYGAEVTELSQDASGVTVRLADGDSLRGQYAVGCDGGRSFVRTVAGIEFPGWDATTSSIIAEVEMTETPTLGMTRDAQGTHGLGRVNYEIRDGKIVYADTGTVRVMITEAQVGGRDTPTLGELRAALVGLYGTDFGAHSPTWLSRFSDTTRQAATYRQGRVLLAGDAAHVHPPTGGQGLNIGVQDAVNLGWKLAAVVRGTSPESLLDTYHAERHPVAAHVLKNTMAQIALMRTDDRTEALRDVMTGVLSVSEARTRIAAMITGLDVHYALGDGHPLLGRRMPDIEIITDRGAQRVYTLMHRAPSLLLDFGGLSGSEFAPWARGAQVVRARYDGAWTLPVIGEVPAPHAVLVRPDGHVAWVSGEP